MKQRKKIQLSVAIISTLLTTQAYSQLYVNAGGGYGFSAAGNSSFASTDNTSNSVNNISTFKISNNTGSFGKGLQLGATVGYMFSENIGAELNIGYLLGSKSTNTNNQTRLNGSNSSTDTYSGKMLRLTPALRFSVGKDKLKPYMRVGLVIGVGGKIAVANSSTDVNISGGGVSTTTIKESETTVNGGVSLGFAAGVGVNYMFSDKLGIFAEMGIITQSWAPTKALLTKSTTNGIDNLSSMTTSQKETNYVSSYTDVNGASSPGVPSTQLKMNTPFSSFGINLGIHFAFGK